MSSLEPFILTIKPAVDAFVRQPSTDNLNHLESELQRFNWMHMNIFNVQILVPLVLKLDELNDANQDIRTGCLKCITLVTSKVYLKELTALRTMLVVILKQIRECDKAAMKVNLSEEIKLASVQCLHECLRRSTSDVLEQFYCRESSMILGQILLTLVDLIENEKYKKLVLASLDCLLNVFYVHDEADRMDVVLRNQVANVLFIFLPKIVTILYRNALADEKIGENIKIKSITTLSRILCVIYEETTQDVLDVKYDVEAFKKLISASYCRAPEYICENDILGVKKNRDQLEARMSQIQIEGRTVQWNEATSKKLRILFSEMCILRSHTSTKVRKEYADMCCLLIQNCAHSLKENFVYMLESVIALTEDDDVHIRNQCISCLENLQAINSNDCFFDDNAEILLDEHLIQLPGIIQRCDDAEQYTELIFLNGFIKSISSHKLQLLFSIPHNLDMFCMCLLSALELTINITLLVEEYSLRDVDIESDFKDASKLPWRNFKHILSERCVMCLKDICNTLGRLPVLNRIVMHHLMEMLQHQNPAINEILLIMLWISTAKNKDKSFKYKDLEMVKQLLHELLDNKHWHLALEPNKATCFGTTKPSGRFVDRTPGLYESALEIRTQDCDSDDEIEEKCLQNSCRVTIADAEYNVLHTCLILDYLGHCALYMGERFDTYIFQSIHKVLLKLAHSNSMVYKAANFALQSIQKALRFNSVAQLLETHTDYIAYHLNALLRKAPNCKSAVDILTVVLQYSSRNALPHLESIFQTVYEECCKAYQTQNIASYLKVFYAFLHHITSWIWNCDLELSQSQKEMEIDQTDSLNLYGDLLSSWQEILSNKQQITEHVVEENLTSDINTECTDDGETNVNGKKDMTDQSLPRHVNVIKSILEQVTKFITSSDLQLQILSLECLTIGLPLLKKYENELLPLVHKIWSPLVEKFRQRNVLVLNRCFSLLGVLATHAREFITKRSLENISELVNEAYEKERSWLKEKLKNKLLSLKIDMATRLHRGVMGINIQFYSESKIIIKTLGCIELTKRHTAEYLKAKVESVLENFGIEKKSIYTITTDNGRNLIKMLRLFGDEDEIESDYTDILREISVFSVQSVKCAAHSLQLVVKDYLDTISKDLLKCVRDLVKDLRTPTYRNKTNNLNLLQISMDVVTRWNPTYFMIKSLLPYKSVSLKNVDAALNLGQSE